MIMFYIYIDVIIPLSLYGLINKIHLYDLKVMLWKINGTKYNASFLLYSLYSSSFLSFIWSNLFNL